LYWLLAVQAPQNPQICLPKQNQQSPRRLRKLNPALLVMPTEETSSGAISSLDEAKNAVIQIEADGTFVNPDFSVSYNNA